MPKEKVQVTDTVVADLGSAMGVTPDGPPPAPAVAELCGVCDKRLGQQRYRANDTIVCSVECAKVVHGDS